MIKKAVNSNNMVDNLIQASRELHTKMTASSELHAKNFQGIKKQNAPTNSNYCSARKKKVNTNFSHNCKMQSLILLKQPSACSCLHYNQHMTSKHQLCLS